MHCLTPQLSCEIWDYHSIEFAVQGRDTMHFKTIPNCITCWMFHILFFFSFMRKKKKQELYDQAELYRQWMDVLEFGADILWYIRLHECIRLQQTRLPRLIQWLQYMPNWKPLIIQNIFCCIFITCHKLLNGSFTRPVQGICVWQVCLFVCLFV